MFRALTISLVLVLVTGAANIEGKANQEQEEPQQQLHVRVYDYAQVSPEVLAEAKRAASSIFRRIGVEILWTDHFLNGRALKRIAGLGYGQRSLQLRVLDRRMSERLAVNKTMTGLAFQGTGGELGKVANVFYSRVEELAGSKLCSKGEVPRTRSRSRIGPFASGQPGPFLHWPYASHAGTQRASRCCQR